MIDTDKPLADSDSLVRSIIIKWDSNADISNDVINELGSTIDVLNSHRIGNQNVAFVTYPSEEFADKAAQIRNDNFTINKVIGDDGISLQDSICLLKMSDYENNCILKYLVELLTIFTSRRRTLVDNWVDELKSTLSQLLDNCELRVFGSFSSKLRSQASSDIDITLLGAQVTIKDLYQSLVRINKLKESFNIHFVASARVPLIVLKYKKDLNLRFDISINNKSGIEKAHILTLFMERDASGMMRYIMLFMVHWARCNRLLSGVYKNEHLEDKTGFNSYVVNHMVIHFVQFYAKKLLLSRNMDPDSRVQAFAFYEHFRTIEEFLRQFFLHFSRIDWIKSGIYNNKIMTKDVLCKCHGIKEAHMVIIDPFDERHNIAAQVTSQGIRRFNYLIRNSLQLLKHKNMRIYSLLEAHSFGIKEKNHKETIVFNIPDIIQNKEELKNMLVKILRFEIIGEDDDGIVLLIYSRTWIGRRKLRKILKRDGMSDIDVELKISEQLDIDTNEPIGRIWIKADFEERKGVVNVVEGNIADIRDATHFMFEHFLKNVSRDFAGFGMNTLSLA